MRHKPQIFIAFTPQGKWQAGCTERRRRNFMYLDASTFIEETSIEEEILRLQKAEDERTRCTIVASLIGAILGWAIGVGQLIIVGSWDLVAWTYMPLIPFYSGLGWALFGMILG